MTADGYTKEEFIKDFLEALGRRGNAKGWSKAERHEARCYAQGLVAPPGTSLPQIHPSLAETVNNVFAFGCAWNERKRTSRTFTFNGEGQPWFPALFKQKQKEAGRERKRRKDPSKNGQQYSSKSRKASPNGTVTASRAPQPARAVPLLGVTPLTARMRQSA